MCHYFPLLLFPLFSLSVALTPHRPTEFSLNALFAVLPHFLDQTKFKTQSAKEASDSSTPHPSPASSIAHGVVSSPLLGWRGHRMGTFIPELHILSQAIQAANLTKDSVQHHSRSRTFQILKSNAQP